MTSPASAPVRVNPVCVHPSERRLGLGGQWRFRLDPADEGLKRRWHEDIGPLGETIEVPGCWQGQGFGNDGTDEVWDFRLSARTFRATYKGTGWYGRSFGVPGGWRGRRIHLNFGGAHPSAEVWLNGARLGENAAPFVPFGFEVTDRVRFDAENVLAVRVHEANRELGFSYNWQGNWSGLYRTVELVATGPARLRWPRIIPDVDGERLAITAQLDGLDALSGEAVLRVAVTPVGEDAAAATAECPVNGHRAEFSVPLPSPRLWSPDAPSLYRVDAALVAGDEVLDALSERAGFVKLSTRGKHFLVNGQPYYMRGTGDFQAHPETGCPDTDRDRWRRKLRTLRDCGYNYVRCQSYVPAPEYFDVADEVGLLVQSEMGMLGGWGGHDVWHVYGWPAPTAGVREAIKRQWDRVVMRDVNHPSANLYCMSNELGGSCLFPRTAWQCDRDTKAIKPTAFVIWTDGGHSDELPEDFVNADASADATCEKPLIQHEFRWWSSLPDVRIMDKYSGALRPWGAEIALAAARRHGIEHVLPAAAGTSAKLQYVEAKGKMEACRRDHPTLAGICHFSAMDMNPSPQGVFDEFYQRKLISAESWRRTNGDTVILASLAFAGRILVAGQTLKFGLSVSDFSHPPLRRPELAWRLAAGQQRLAEGQISYDHEPFCTCPVGEVELTVPDVAAPVKATLSAELTEADRTLRNQWDLWLFGARAAALEDVAIYGAARHTWLRTVQSLPQASANDLAAPGRYPAVLTERLDQALGAFMRAGGRVILAASEGLVRPFGPKLGSTLGRYFFLPPASYPPYEDGHQGTILAHHPMLGELPHEDFADLQFFRMIADAAPLELEPVGLNAADPVLRVMHSYQVGRSLAYLTECAVGRGGMVLCALDLDQSWPEAACLLAGICRYAAGEDFAPQLRLPDDALAKITRATLLP